MDSHILEPCARPNPSPGMLEVGEVGAGFPADDHLGIVLVAGQRREDADRGRRERDHSRTGLRIAQPQFRRVHVDVLPAQGLDFAQPAAGQHEQANCGHGRRRLRARGLDLGQHQAEPLEFLVSQETLAPLLLVLLHEAARVAAVRPQAPGFRKVEHLADDFEDPVRLVGRGPVPVVQRRDVFAFDIVDGELAELGQHELLHQPAAARDGPWLAAHFDMLDEVPLREVGNRGGVGSPPDGRLGIFSGLDARDHLPPALRWACSAVSGLRRVGIGLQPPQTDPTFAPRMRPPVVTCAGRACRGIPGQLPATVR